MIIVTGGAGFIGSCMVATLNAAGRDDILVVDNLRTGDKWKNLVDHSFIDIVSKEQFLEDIEHGRAPSDIDGIIHLGACSATTERDADYLLENNHHYSMAVTNLALKRNARFIYASSAATYGSGADGYADTTVDLRPLNMYGYSKHLFDMWMRRHGFDARAVGLKFFNVFGPNEYHKGDMASMVYKAVQQIQATGRVRLFRSNDARFGDGGQMRDFVYVKDCCRIMRDLLLERTDVNGILNLGTGRARSWNDLMNAVFDAMDREPVIDYVDMPAHLAGQYQNFTEADMRSYERQMFPVVFEELEDSVADYVRGHLLAEWPYLHHRS